MWFQVKGHGVFAGTGGRDFDATKPTVLLVHGAGMDHSVWALHDRALAHSGHCVLSIDLPGHGRSEGEAQTSIAAVADWLADVVAVLAVGPVVVVGHSMGALAALALAARHPARVRSIVLLGGAAAMPVHADLLRAAAEDLPAAIAMITNWGFSAAATLGGNKAPGLWMVGGAATLLARSRPGVLATDFAACQGYESGAGDAAHVACPALVVAGGRDRMASAQAGRDLAGLLPAERFELLRDAGHMMMSEQPDAVLDLLLSAVG